MTSTNSVELLRRVNSRLHGVIEALNPQRHSCLNLQAEDLSNMLADLLRAGDCLRETPNDPASLPAELVRERAQYHGNLLELERLLPDLYTRLFAERARLVDAREHLDAAAEWAGGSQNTF